MKQLLKTEPVRLLQIIGAALAFVAALVGNIVADLPAGANWTVIAAVVAQHVIGQLARRFVFSGQTIEVRTDKLVEVTASGVTATTPPVL